MLSVLTQGDDYTVPSEPYSADLAPERKLPNAFLLVVIPHHDLDQG